MHTRKQNGYYTCNRYMLPLTPVKLYFANDHDLSFPLALANAVTPKPTAHINSEQKIIHLIHITNLQRNKNPTFFYFTWHILKHIENVNVLFSSIKWFRIWAKSWLCTKSVTAPGAAGINTAPYLLAVNRANCFNVPFILSTNFQNCYSCAGQFSDISLALNKFFYLQKLQF